MCFGKFGKDFGVRYHNCHEEALKGISIDEDLTDKRSLNVYVLKFLGGDILSLGKLEDIFGAVHNFDITIRENYRHITRVDPAVLGKGFCSFLWVLVVALKESVSVELELSSRVRLIGVKVAHLRNILEAESDAWCRSTNCSSRIYIVLICEGSN